MQRLYFMFAQFPALPTNKTQTTIHTPNSNTDLDALHYFIYLFFDF